jgi:pimeloyl-ACP methyl ester carboxylesterase
MLAVRPRLATAAPEDFCYSVDGCAGYLATLLDQLGITRAHVVAHDFGGSWALAWAARHPQTPWPAPRSSRPAC